MGESSVMVSLPQMVDLALNCPEVGAVNFNILHSLLHVLIQQVDLLECNVEFKGGDSERVQNLIATSKPGPSLNLTEYIVTPGKDQRKVITKKTKYKKPKTEGDKKLSKEEVFVEKELRVIEQRRDSNEDPAKNPSPMSSVHHMGSGGSMHTVVVVEPTDGATSQPHVSVALSRAHFDNLEDEIQKLKEEMIELKELPGNIGLIEALRSAAVDKTTPVLDMFQILTLSKRIDATETGISKLASMLEDLAKERSGIPLSQTDAPSGAGNVKDKIDKLDKRVQKLEEGEAASKDKAVGTGVDMPPTERISDLENKFAEYTEQVATLDAMFNNQVSILQGQFTDLEKEIGEIVERINAGMPAGDFGADQNLSDLYNKVVQMQEEMENMATTAAKLLDDKEERQSNMDAVLEQIELLKTIKANREDLEDALADKADTCAVNRKVSHDQFDAACDDLAHGIEDALSKLTQQEQLWQQALDDIQREIETKLDKMELTPLRDFVHNKLKMLQERLKALAALKRETEAAGTKSKFLRNVNCISCDKEVIMRKQLDPATMPPPPSLPPNKSMAPYLAYELDALRRQQKCAPHGRNMNHFENAMGSKGKGDEDHICNRYCGGSHTVTTPQQRVARLGHFLQQWGPDTQPVAGTIRGTDGQMYKAREGGELAPVQEDENIETYSASTKTRPSMVVQGDILTTRSGIRSAASKASENEPRKSGEHRESQTMGTHEQRHSASLTKRTSKESPRGSVTEGHRGSKDAGKRGSRASATQHRASQDNVKRSSRISIKEEAHEGGEAPAGEHGASPAEGDAEEGQAPEAPAEAAEETPAEAPAEAGAAEEAAPEEAPPAEAEPEPEAPVE